MCLVVASGAGWIFISIGFPETNIVLLYLLSVLFVARFTPGYVHGIIASILATGAYNFLFTEPYYTLSVHDPSYVVTFAIMTITAIITSTLTSKIKLNAKVARENEADANALYRLTNKLTDAGDIQSIARILVSSLSDSLGTQVAFVCYTATGEPEHTFLQQSSPDILVRREVQDIELLRHQMEGLRTDFHSGAEFYDWPVYGKDVMLGIVRIPSDRAMHLGASDIRLLHAMMESASMAMDRLRSIQQRITTSEEATQERYRGNLLRAISHDLRTPLASIMGTAEMILGMTNESEETHLLAKEIHDDSQWLHSLVENILNLTRLHEGKVVMEKQLEAVEEVIGVALGAMAKFCQERNMVVHIPDDVLLVPMDAKLIEQVLVNLLDNAVKHTLPTDEICVTVRKTEHTAVFSVADRGTGIAPSDLPRIFQMFYSARRGKDLRQTGIGLGLSLCESIVKAHGGTIRAGNRTDGPGAEFEFVLPLQQAVGDQDSHPDAIQVIDHAEQN